MPHSVEPTQHRGRGLKVLVAEALTKLGKFIVGLIGFAVAAYVLANPDVIGSLRYLVAAIAIAWGGAWFYLALPRAPQIPVRSAQAPVTVDPVAMEEPGRATPPAQAVDAVATQAAAPPA